jgi:Xaa-Pro dipeptidase
MSDEGAIFLVTRELELSSVLTYSLVSREHVYLYSDNEDPITRTFQVLSELEIRRGRVGIEKGNWFLTPERFETLQATLPHVSWINSSGVIEQLRFIKSPGEIRYIRQAARAVASALRAGLEVVRDGTGEHEVAAAIYASLYGSGCDYVAFVPWIRSGPKVGMMHDTWSTRSVKKGEVLFTEVYGCVKRYHAASTRCASIGQPSAEVRKMAGICLEGLRAMMSAIRPGVAAEAVDRACREPFESAGLGQALNHRSGYSIGIGFPPSGAESYVFSIVQGVKELMQPGMVFHLVPTISQHSGTGYGISETVLVTDDGCEPLVGLEYELYVR